MLLGLLTLPTFASTDVRLEIDAANRAFEQAFARQDSVAIAELFTTDGRLMPPGAPAIAGRDAIRDFWKVGMSSAVPLRIRITTVDLDTHAMTAIETGTFEVQTEAGLAVDSGKYLVVWKRVGEGWRMHRDIFNSDRASQP